MLYVDGIEVVNIFDIIKKLNGKLLDAIDCLYEARQEYNGANNKCYH